MLQPIVHYGIHFVIPLLIAFIFFKSNWKMAYVVMIFGMLIDVDHLLANPIFSSNRCSINFHPLHSYYAMVIYVMLLFFKKTRVLGLGLVIHIVADTADCLLM